MYEYPCRLIRVVNGNTVEADIDLGFGISIKQRIRLFGVDDTEDSMSALIKILPRDFICQTVYNKRGKVGRVLGHLFKEDETGALVNINEMLIDQGLAKKFSS
jgi:micrococcal nuclease